MQPSDKQKFLTVLAGVHDFYAKELSTYAGQVWWQACERFDVEQVTKALSAHLMDADRGQWLPKPADIVRQLQGTHTDRSLMAWGKVHEAIQRVGAYASVDFGDDATHAAIMDMGGWTVLCRSTVDELPFLQRRFCEAHRVYAQRGAEQAPRVLIGEHESQNRLAGKPTAQPVVLGARPEQVRIGTAA
jgi:hypothetical protein